MVLLMEGIRSFLGRQFGLGLVHLTDALDDPSLTGCCVVLLEHLGPVCVSADLLSFVSIVWKVWLSYFFTTVWYVRVRDAFLSWFCCH